MENISFTDKLREAAKALASGSKDEIVLSAGFLEYELSGKKAATTPGAYIRTIMGRVPEVKEIGTIKVKKSICEDVDSDYLGMEIYTVTVSKEKRKKVFNKAEVDRAKRDAVAKAAERFLLVSPCLANYTPEEYATIAKVMQEIHGIIKDQFINSEDE